MSATPVQQSPTEKSSYTHRPRIRRKRSREEKRRDVIRLLLDVAYANRSDSYVASIARVSQPFVSEIRRDLSQNILSVRSAKRIGADGVVRNTARIGKRRRITPQQQSFILNAIHLGAYTIKELMDESGLTRPRLQLILDHLVTSRIVITAPRRNSIGGRPELLYMPAPNTQN